MEMLRSARGITGAYYRLAIAEASLARGALLSAVLQAGIALVLALIASLAASAALIAGLMALGLGWPWATLLVAAVAALGAVVGFRGALRRLDDTRFEATRRQIDKLFERGDEA